MAIFFSVELHAPSFVMKRVYFREKKVCEVKYLDVNFRKIKVC